MSWPSWSGSRIVGLPCRGHDVGSERGQSSPAGRCGYPMLGLMCAICTIVKRGRKRGGACLVTSGHAIAKLPVALAGDVIGRLHPIRSTANRTIDKASQGRNRVISSATTFLGHRPQPRLPPGAWYPPQFVERLVAFLDAF